MRAKEVFPFGVYDLTLPDNVTMMATHITTTVQALLRASGLSTDGGLEQDEALAAGCLLEWAQECLAYHGLESCRVEMEQKRAAMLYPSRGARSAS